MIPSKIADKITEILRSKGFVIQRYDSLNTYPVYLKLDYGVCNTIRISNHEDKNHLRYRYNMIIGRETNIVEDDEYIRYYFDEGNTNGLINQILFDKMVKIKRYGKQAYKNFMIKNMQKYQNDKLWKDANLVNEDSFIDPTTGDIIYRSQLQKSRTKPENPIKLQQMPDGTYACRPSVVLNLFEKVIVDNMQLNESAKFQPDETLKVTASYEQLEAYYMTTGETDRQAKTHALQILGKPGCNIGTNLGATQCEEGMFYTLELPLIPMEFLPEEFLSRV